MEPKFQSSFIPKGPVAPSDKSSLSMRRTSSGGGLSGLLYYVASAIFLITVFIAFGVFGYKFYLKYRIDQMGSALEAARNTIQSESIDQLIRLNNRIKTVQALVSRHVALTPLFDLLEASTPTNVRFTDFSYTVNEGHIDLAMKGQATSYGALALLSDVLDKNKSLQDPVFSDLTLDDKGNVVFSFKATVDPQLVSYQRQVELTNAPAATVTTAPVTTTTTVTSTSTSATSSTKTQ